MYFSAKVISWCPWSPRGRHRAASTGIDSAIFVLLVLARWESYVRSWRRGRIVRSWVGVAPWLAGDADLAGPAIFEGGGRFSRPSRSSPGPRRLSLRPRRRSPLGLAMWMRAGIRPWPMPQISAHWMSYSPVTVGSNQPVITRPGIASCLSRKTGTEKLWSTSFDFELEVVERVRRDVQLVDRGDVVRRADRVVGPGVHEGPGPLLGDHADRRTPSRGGPASRRTRRSRPSRR